MGAETAFCHSYLLGRVLNVLFFLEIVIFGFRRNFKNLEVRELSCFSQLEDTYEKAVVEASGRFPVNPTQRSLPTTLVLFHNLFPIL